jgi:hypothetical protein
VGRRASRSIQINCESSSSIVNKNASCSSNSVCSHRAVEAKLRSFSSHYVWCDEIVIVIAHECQVRL